MLDISRSYFNFVLNEACNIKAAKCALHEKGEENKIRACTTSVKEVKHSVYSSTSDISLDAYFYIESTEVECSRFHNSTTRVIAKEALVVEKNCTMIWVLGQC